MTRALRPAALSLTILLVAAAPAGAAPDKPRPAASGAHEGEAKSIEKLLTAPCCYKGTLEDHTSGVATQMRQEIRTMLAAGKSRAQILAHYKKKYGQAILVEPPKGGLSGFFLYGIPFGLAIIGLIVMTALMALRRRREGADDQGDVPDHELPPEMEARIDALVAGKPAGTP